ncbi:MAG: hypothetical protein P8Y60_19980, partial [Calditrichota bacterium]
MSSSYQSNFNIKENKDGSYKLTSTVKIDKIYLSERSTKINYFDIYEPFYAKVSKIKGIFRNKTLSKKKIYFEFADFEDSFISEYKIHTLLFPNDIKPHEKLYYEYKQSYSDIAFLPIIYIPNIDLVRSCQIIFEHPEDHLVEFEFFFPRDTIPYTINTSDRKKTILTFENIKELKPINYIPFNEFHAAILVTLRKNDNLVNPTSVPQFMEWYGKLINLSPALGETYHNILAEKFSTAGNEIQKLEIIHDFVRNNIRYIADEQSMYAFIPRQPDYILDHSYGDCKDRAYLSSALAARENLNVNMALVSTEPCPPFKGVHVLQFNHVICA